MKVLHVSKAYPPVIGGIETILGEMAEGLAARGVEVDVLVCNNRLRTEIEERENLRIIRVASPGKVASMHLGPSTPLRMRNLKRDITHVHVPYPAGVLSSLMAQRNSKLVVTWHSDIVRQKRLLKFYGPFLRKFLRRCDAVYPTSPNLIDASSFLPEVREKCRPIPLGIHPDHYALSNDVRERADAIREEFGPFVLFIGRFVSYKAPLDLVEAMANVDARVVFIGSGPLEEAIRGRASRLGISSRVRILRNASEALKIAHLHAASVFALPSITPNEAFGVVLLEAMACGLPLVTSDLPTGVTWVNRDGENGLIFPRGDTKALAENLNRLLGNARLAHDMGERGRQRLLAELTVDRMVDAQVAAYNDLLG